MKPKKDSLSPTPVPNSVAHSLIAERAQSIWRERGSPHGQDMEHWLEAERQLRSSRSGEDIKPRSPDFSPDRDNPLKMDIDKALDQMDNPGQQRSATSL